MSSSSIHFPNRGTCALGYFEAHRFLRLALQYRSPFHDMTRRHDIGHLQLHQIAAPELTVVRRVEERQIAIDFGKFETYSNRRDVFWIKRVFIRLQYAFDSRLREVLEW